MASPSGSYDPLSTFAFAVPPTLAAMTVTSWAMATGGWFGGLTTVTSAVACAVAPLGSTTVSSTEVMPNRQRQLVDAAIDGTCGNLNRVCIRGSVSRNISDHKRVVGRGCRIDG